MKEIFQQFGIWSVFDIALISFVIYHVLLLIRGTRAAQMLGGILIIVAAFLLSSIMPLTTLNWVMNKFYSSFIIILIIIFQDDIRHVLSRMGKKPFVPGSDSTSSQQILDEIVRAATALASKRIGALIVLDRNIILTRYINISIGLDAQISKELIMSIFHTTSPIHDGAIIIQRGRISAAGCFLPLTRKENVDPNMGTRHRAAIGVSQETDAVVVLVSEEGGSISLAVDGIISQKMDPKALKVQLNHLMLQADEERVRLITEQSTPPFMQTALTKLRSMSWGAKK